jgi:FkbM family methyltransferase
MNLILSCARNRMLSPIWSRVHQVALIGMNYWASMFDRSGEKEAVTFVAQHLVNVTSPVIFDVGANVGEFSLHCQKIFGSSCVIYAFEPANATFDELTRRTKDLAPSVKPHQVGISNVLGEAILHSSEPCSTIASLVLLERPIRPFDPVLDEKVVLTTIDCFCAEMDIQRIHFLKLDIEGHELAALDGARMMLEQGRIDCIQFEFGENNISSRTFLGDFVKRLEGFDLFRVVPGGPISWTYKGGASEIFATMNYLAVHHRNAG